MKFLILAIFVAITAFLIWRSKQNTDPTEQACAIEIGNLLKANPDAKPQAIADVFMEHGIDPSRCGNPPEKQRCLKVEFSVSYTQGDSA